MKNEKRQHNLEDLILEQLKTGSKKMSQMILLLGKKRPGTTKQGVYASLRVLRVEEKIVVHGGFASLSIVWLQKMSNYFTLAQHHYMTTDARDTSFLNLNDGEIAQYFFRDSVQTDAFWSHAFTLLMGIVPVTKPLYLYNPHDWFLFARHDHEKALIDTVVSSGRQYSMVVGGRMPLDQSIAKEFDGIRARYCMLDTPMFVKQNYYLNLVGDFLIEVYLDKEVALKIEDFFKNTIQWTSEAEETLKAIIGSRGRSRLVISRNAKKASRLILSLQSLFERE